MAGGEAAVGEILVAVIGVILVARRQAARDGTSVSIPVAIATGVALALVAVGLFGWVVVAVVGAMLDRLAR
jgi:hypothetical protein